MERKKKSANLALLIERESLWVKFFDHLLRRAVFLDLALKVEADHVARVDLGRELEELGETLLLSLFDVLGRHVNDEMYVDIIVVFFVILQVLAQYGKPIRRKHTYFDDAITFLANHSL